MLLSQAKAGYIFTEDIIAGLALVLCVLSIVFAILPFVFLVAALRVRDRVQIKSMVKRGLFNPAYGNPLHFHDGERLPRVRCHKLDGPEKGKFVIFISAVSATVDDLTRVTQSLSASLNKKFRRYAVVQAVPDVACNEVAFMVEDLARDRTLTFSSVDDMKQDNCTKLRVQDGASIDLTTSGSMLVAGKTRSGKTTGIISLLLQVLLHGPDAYGSRVTIIDPKQAELSQLPHVVTLDEQGTAKPIIKAIQHFASSIVERQKILNDLSEKKGDAVHWWKTGMHVSLLFIGEYVSLRSYLPKKPSKDDPDYCLEVFDDLLKRIVTMEASAGCYVIISVAEASVESGGLPAMLRSAMSTRVLFRPTLPEARLMWDSEKLRDMPERDYGPGDAWFSSTDGTHDAVSYVHYPCMMFPVYAELGRLLRAYYGATEMEQQEAAAVSSPQ